MPDSSPHACCLSSIRTFEYSAHSQHIVSPTRPHTISSCYHLHPLDIPSLGLDSSTHSHFVQCAGNTMADTDAGAGPAEDAKQCRICLEGEDPQLGRLIRPCLCKGSISVSICLSLLRAFYGSCDRGCSMCTSSVCSGGGTLRPTRAHSTHVHSAGTGTISLALGW